MVSTKPSLFFLWLEKDAFYVTKLQISPLKVITEISMRLTRRRQTAKITSDFVFFYSNS